MNFTLANLSHICHQIKARIVLLVGNNCIIDCNLNEMKTKVLWDTGSQVSVISRRFLKKNFRCLPDCKLELPMIRQFLIVALWNLNLVS